MGMPDLRCSWDFTFQEANIAPKMTHLYLIFIDIYPIKHGDVRLIDMFDSQGVA